MKTRKKQTTENYIKSMQNYKYVLSLILVFNINTLVFAQSLSTGTPIIEDYYRRAQLLGEISIDHSFVSYPLFPTNAFGVINPYDPENILEISRFTKFDGNIRIKKNNFQLLPLSWKNQYNSHHPEGINDGAMVPSRGYQTLISTGFYFQSGRFSIKLQPEFVHAANPEYDGFPVNREEQSLADQRWYEYYGLFLNLIDLPERFGNSAYNNFLWGQSSIRLTLNTVSVGLSTENLWWGPGMRNSLLMTNSAPGFAHFTLNSVQPIKTLIGSFEGQVIAGWLKESGYMPPQHERTIAGIYKIYVPKPLDGRYINGMILSYQPKWVPGLFIGLIRSSQIYLKDMGSQVIDYLPIFSAFSSKVAEGENEADLKKNDFYNSVFFRFVWPESHVEIYSEMGRSGYCYDKRDLILEAEHSMAYNFGFRKLIPLKKGRSQYIQIHMELTQLAKNSTTVLRGGQSWYTSSVLPHGYTNRGQYLGAGIGSGSNLQTLDISWIKSLKMIGLQFERMVHNEDFFFERIKDIRVHWVDLSAALNCNWDYKNLLFNIHLKAVISKNYQWVLDDEVLTIYWDEHSPDIFNFHGQLSVVYRF